MATAVVVTGASRGFGRAAAIALTAELATKPKRTDVVTDVFLWARNAAKLQDTERAVERVAETHGANVRTFSSSVDLGAQASYVPQVESLVQQLQRQEPPYEAIYVVHNAATVGQLGCTEVWQSASELASYWELNLNHVCFLNARLLAAFCGQTTTQLVLVNISSGVATHAIAGSGHTDMVSGFVLLGDHAQVHLARSLPRAVQLNYSPGAMDTEMQDEIRESMATPAETRAMFVSYKENGQLVRAEDSALYCAQVVVKDAYESGSTVRYDRSQLVARDGLFQ